MSTAKKIWLGILTFLPLFLFILYFVMFFVFFLGNIGHMEDSHHRDDFPIHMFASLFWIFMIIILASLLSIGIMIYYIIHANNNKANDNTKKIMWTIILIFTSTIGSIVYYFVEILPSKKSLSSETNLVNEEV